jgi:hypothetical protein
MLNTTIGLQLLRDAEQVAIPAPPFRPPTMGFLDGINVGICMGKQEQEIAMLRSQLEDKDKQLALQLQAEEHAAAADDDSRPTCYTIFTCIHPLLNESHACHRWHSSRKSVQMNKHVYIQESLITVSSQDAPSSSGVELLF